MLHFSEKDLLNFLTGMAKEGALPANTAKAQKAAVSKMLSVLGDDEKQRLVAEDIDIDLIYQRFIKLCGNDLSPGSMKVYKASFNTALQSYIQWKNFPDQKPFLKTRKKKQIATKMDSNAIDNNEMSRTVVDPDLYAPPVKLCKFIVPVRPNEFAHLELPFKLSNDEAKRINEFVAACTKSLIFQKSLNDAEKYV